MLDRTYQNIKWVRLNKEKDLISRIEKIKILIMLIIKNSAKEKKRDRSLFFKGIGVVRFKINRRKYADPEMHALIKYMGNPSKISKFPDSETLKNRLRRK